MDVNLSDLFWIFLVLSLLQPWIRQRMLERSRTQLMQALEARRGSRVIVLVHRQETLGFLGFPLFRFINVEDAEKVIRAIHLTDPQVPIDLVLHTPGGLVLPSLQIARAIARHPGKVTAIVPHYAMSGGTLIALAADQIIMSKHAVLGPVDPQIGTYPAASILRAVRRKPVEHVDDQTLILADQADMAIAQLKEAVQELICSRLPAEQCQRLAAVLAEGRWTHDYAITVEAAAQMGLKVTTDMPEEVLELMTLYPQPVRPQAGVEFIPGPRGPAPGRERPAA